MTKVWIGAGVSLLAAGIALYALLGDRDDSKSKKTPAPDIDNPTAGGTTNTSTQPAGERPSVPVKRPKKEERTAPYVEHYTKDGVRVRDKRDRGLDTSNMEKPRRPFKALKIDAKVVAEMGNQLRNVARKCRKEHPGDLSAGARVQPRVGFEIKNGQLSVTDAELSLEAIDKDSEFSRCFYSGTIGLAVAASGHRDVEHHRMLVPIDMDKI